MNVEKKILSSKIYPLNRDLRREWQVRYYTNEGGKLQKHIKRVPVKLKTIAEREQWTKDFLDKIENGLSTDDVCEMANKHLKRLFEILYEKKIKPKTRSTYHSHIVGLNDYCKEHQTKSITNTVAVAFLEHLKDEHEGRTVNHYRRTLREFFGIMKKKREIKTNPFEDTERAATKQAFSEHYGKDEMSIILKKVKESNPALILPMLTIYYCFVRNGQELPHIKISDIDFETGKIWIDNKFAKNKKQEAVLIPRQLMCEYLKNGLHLVHKDMFAFGHNGKPSVKPVSQNYYQNHFRKILIECGLYKKGKGIYRMKNEGNVALVKANFNKTAIQKQNRHASYSTTENYLKSLRVDDFDELKDKFPSLY